MYIYIYVLALLDLCVSSLRRGHTNIICIVQMLTDDPRKESKLVLREKGACKHTANLRTETMDSEGLTQDYGFQRV